MRVDEPNQSVHAHTHGFDSRRVVNSPAPARAEVQIPDVNRGTSPRHADMLPSSLRGSASIPDRDTSLPRASVPPTEEQMEVDMVVESLMVSSSSPQDAEETTLSSASLPPLDPTSSEHLGDMRATSVPPPLARSPTPQPPPSLSSPPLVICEATPTPPPQPSPPRSPLLAIPVQTPPPRESTESMSLAPAPAPPPKVKMSLKDFAARKKKQREEGKSAEASPMGVVVKALTPDGEGVAAGAGVGVGADGKSGERETRREVGGGGDTGEVHKEVEGGGGIDVRTKAPRDSAAVNGHGRVKDEDVEMADVKDRERPSGNIDHPQTRKTAIDEPSSKPTMPPPRNTTQDALSLKAKAELIEQDLPNGLRDINKPRDLLPFHKASLIGAIPTKPDAALRALLGRQISQEDGEFSSTVPAANVVGVAPASTTPMPTTTPSTTATTTTGDTPAKRPPTGPRLFRPSPPYIQVGNNGRPVPSAPRALRANGNNGAVAMQYNPPAFASNRTYSGMQALPRGPSADRERMDWERDRSRTTTNSRARGGAGGGGGGGWGGR